MKSPSCLLCFLGLALLAAPAFADQNLAGNVTITSGPSAGNLNVQGTIDNIGNSFFFGTQGSSYGGALLYSPGLSADTFTFSINYTPASWLWVHNASVPAMRLDSSHNLLLYPAGANLTTTPASITFSPAANPALSLGTATLTFDGTTVNTNKPLYVGGNLSFAGADGSVTTNSSGIALAAVGGNKSVTLGATGTGDLIFNAGGTERARIKSTGNVGIGTTSPLFPAQVTVGTAGNDVLLMLEQKNGFLAGGTALIRAGRTTGTTDSTIFGFDYDSNGFQVRKADGSTKLFSVLNSGNVGIGTSTPGFTLDVSGQAHAHYLWAGGGYDGRIYLRNAANTVVTYLDGASGANNYINNGGNVGIGTTSTSALLEVSKASSDAAARQEVVRVTTTGRSAGGGTPDRNALITFYDSANPTYTGALGGYRINSNNDYNGGLQFYVNNTGASPGQSVTGLTEAMRITNAGNVGIGTTSPSAPLEVSKNWSHFLPLLTLSDTNTSTVGQGLVFKTAWSNSVARNWAIQFQSVSGSDFAIKQSNVQGGDPLTAGVERLYIQGSGNIGIGTTSPNAKLQVGSWNLIKDGTWAPPVTPPSDSAGERIVFYQGGGWKTAIGMDGQNGIWFQAHTPAGQVAYQWFTGAASAVPAEKMRLMENGNVGIGTIDPGTYKLAVKGSIHAQEVVVDNTNWADYVFDPNYRLAPLAEVEQHIKAEKHLPGIPSAQEIAEHGVSMGDMQSKLLSKIEEITLHQIAQEKEILALKAQNAAFQHQVNELKSASTNP